ncbi:hypothetical protein BDW62DRAFT_204886 [Aspergillus aurantiobrunneus]
MPLRPISIPAIQQRTPNLKLQLQLNPNLTQKTPSISRAFSSTPTASSPAPTSTSGKSQADLIVEELQELYETATDELEIATESTDSATIYAASDREAARDALNSLVIAYELYTNSEPQSEAEQTGERGQGGSEEGEDGIAVELSIDPADVSAEAREEVKKRIGQRIREAKSAVERLETRVHD